MLPLVLLGVGTVLLVALVLHTRHSRNPVFARQVIGSPIVRRDAAATLLLGGLVALLLVFVTLLLTREMKFTPLATAMVLTTMLLPQVVVARRAGEWFDRLGFSTVASRGLIVLVPAVVVLAFGALLEHLWLLVAGLFATGLGLGLLVTLTSSDPQHAMSSELRPETSGLISSSRNLGGAGLVAFGFALASSLGPVAPMWLAVVVTVLMVPVLLRKVVNSDSPQSLNVEVS
jgi:hypothetical protein